MTINDTDYQKIECIHVALQELKNKYSIPDDDCDLEDALQFTEDLREPYLKENENESWASINKSKRIFRIKCKR